VAEWVRQYEMFWVDRLDRLAAHVDRAEAQRQAARAPGSRSTGRRAGAGRRK
jgi:hypothetical protein